MLTGNQPSAEAIQATSSFIQTAIFYNHAGAVHADQGLTTPLHADKNQAPSPFSQPVYDKNTFLHSVLCCGLYGEWLRLGADEALCGDGA